MAVTQLPTPPQRSDPATFAERGDAFMSALPTFQAEINALQITTNAQTAADAAASATSAAEAVVAKNAAIAAWAASMEPAETLPALSQSLHIGAVVKAIVYDTSKDSDGGAWRKRCADKSWYTETLGGDRWIGQHATISAAWTAAGSTTGAVYQASATAGAQTSDLYYTPTSSTTVTQVYRGVTREFPAVAGIVAESTRVVIYDLATGAMWMVFTGGASNPIRTSFLSATAANGKAILATNGNGLPIISFIDDRIDRYITVGKRFSGYSIASRNSAVSAESVVDSNGIVSNTVNDVAITVLDTAVLDYATGLPVPTIFVGTAGGLSTITNAGTVTNSTSTTSVVKVAADGKRLTAIRSDGTVAVYNDVTTMAVAPDATYTASSTPATLGTAASIGNTRQAASTLGLTLLKDNPATVAAGMVAQITTAYSSGWLPGDIRGAFLADTTAETVTASGELVTNGTFTTDTSGWTASQLTGSVATIAVASARLRVTNNAATGRGVAYQTVTTVIGRTYVFSAVGYDGTSGAGNSGVRVGTSIGGYDNTSGNFTDGVQLNLSFAATATTTYITLNNVVATANLYVEFDNISVKLAEPDRSVKNKGLVINGSLTKTAVASGAGLVAWSGFSVDANGTQVNGLGQVDATLGALLSSDFSVCFWRNNTSAARSIRLSTAGLNTYPYSASGTQTGVEIELIGDNLMRLANYASGTRTASNTTTPLTPIANKQEFIVVTRVGNVFSWYRDGVFIQSATFAATATGLGLWIGSGYTGETISLFRISATVPSADQIAHIYRTELPLFQASAQCTIAGSSTAVTALAYDDTTELLHVGTSWGRTGFKDLLRVDSEATTTGALTSLSASQGVIITGGTSGKVYVPAMLLRDELRRKDEARKALGKVPVFFDHTATASQTAFVAPKGYTIKAVYHNGTLKRETTTGVYWTRSTDGFAETATISVGATVSDWISLMCVRT